MDQIIARYNGKQLLGSIVYVSRLTSELVKVLNKLKVIGPKGVTDGLGQAKVMGPYNLAPSFPGIQHAAQQKPLYGLGDILKAFDRWSIEQQMQLKAKTSSATFSIAWTSVFLGCPEGLILTAIHRLKRSFCTWGRKPPWVIYETIMK